MTPSDKRFLMILGGITLLLAGGLIYWGIMGGSRHGDAAERFEQASNDVRRLEAIKPYPKSENLNAEEKAIEDYRKALGELQKQFLAYRPEATTDVSSAEFNTRLLTVVEKAKAALADAGTEIPENFALGFEQYTTSQARQNSTGLLGYQLEGIAELFDLLAQAKPAKVRNFYREIQPEERGGAYEARPNEVGRALPIEITFSGPEKSAREFINALTNTKNHYFVIRSMRVSNQRLTGPTAEEAKFAEPEPEGGGGGGGSDPFGALGFTFPGEEAAEEAAEPVATEPAAAETPAAVAPAAADAPAAEDAEPVEETAAEPAVEDDSNRILKQLVGDEEVNVFLRIDLMLFHDNVTIS